MMDVLLDVGGTGIKTALRGADGGIMVLAEYPAKANMGRDALLKHFEEIILTVRSCAPDDGISSVRMAFPGPFDYDKGVPRLRGLQKYDALYGVSLPDALSAVGCPCWLFMNDAEAFSRGAIAIHALRGRAMFLSIGTGLGSAFSIRGSISTDESEGIPPNGCVYPLPFLDGRLDDYLSVRGLRALGGGKSPLELAASQEGLAVYAAFGERLLEGLRPVVAKFRPECVVLGGGISKSAALFAGALEAWLSQKGIRLIIAEDTSMYTFRGLAGMDRHEH